MKYVYENNTIMKGYKWKLFNVLRIDAILNSPGQTDTVARW